MKREEIHTHNATGRRVSENSVAFVFTCRDQNAVVDVS